jgi:lipopolysaccharide export system protein LptA
MVVFSGTLLLMTLHKTPHMTVKNSLFAVLLTLTLPVADVYALSGDKDEPFLVEADSGVVDEQTGTTIYRGNVTIDQGSLHIIADEIQIITSDGAVVQIIARADKKSSRLAHLEQQPDKKGPVFAEARKISYFIQEERIHLSGDATLKQLNDEFTGELVYYDVAEGIVNLKSDPANNERIKIKYNSKN